MSFHFTHFPCDDWENIHFVLLSSSNRKYEQFIHCLGLGHETMVCAVCLSIFSWTRSVPIVTRWCYQMETFSTLLVICAGNSPVPGEFPAQRPVTRSFDVFFDLRLNKRLSKQSWGWWFDSLSRILWRHCNEYDSTCTSTETEILSFWLNFHQWLHRKLSSGAISNGRFVKMTTFLVQQIYEYISVWFAENGSGSHGYVVDCSGNQTIWQNEIQIQQIHSEDCAINVNESASDTRSCLFIYIYI